MPVTGELRQLAVASPAYIKRHGMLQTSHRNCNHRCIGWGRSANVAPYRWEFSENGQEFSVSVTDTFTTTDMALKIDLAICRCRHQFLAWKKASDRPSHSVSSCRFWQIFARIFLDFYSIIRADATWRRSLGLSCNTCVFRDERCVS